VRKCSSTSAICERSKLVTYDQLYEISNMFFTVSNPREKREIVNLVFTVRNL